MSRKPRLVQVLPPPIESPGGMERVATAIAEVAEGMGLETVSFDDRLAPERQVSRRFPMLNRFGTTLRVSRLVRERLRPDDLLITHSMYGAFLRKERHAYLYHSTFAGQAEAMRELLHPLDYRVCRWGYGWMDGQSGRRGRPVAVSPHVSQEIQRYYRIPRERVQTIANPVVAPSEELLRQRHQLREGLGWEPDTFVVLTIGRYEGVKGKHLLDRLASRVPPGALLVVVAPNISVSPWESERVRLVPGLDRETLWEYTVACDAVLCPSRYESFGLTIAEAWSAGRPVISTNVGIARALRKEEPTLDQMIVDDPLDAEAVLARLSALRAEPELGRQQAEWGGAVVRERFSPERFTAAYRSLLEQLPSA